MKKILFIGAMLWAALLNFAWGSEPPPVVKVLIIPPVLYGNADKSFLQQATVDMLTTRLAKPEKIVILEPGKSETGKTTKKGSSQADALAKGRQKGADYVIFGSLTTLGAGISTDLRVLALADQHLALVFSRSGSDDSALLAHMDQFANQVNQKVFGISQPKTTATTPQQEMTGKEMPPADAVPAVTTSKQIKQGPNIQDQIQGVAVGDLTGDGKMESVYVGLKGVWIYSYANGRFNRMAHIKGRGNYVGVDTADLDDDGRDEIFVTNVNRYDNRLLSFVLVYNGDQFEHRAKYLKYYFRAINLPGRGRVLLGQHQAHNNFFGKKIYEIKFQQGKYRKGDPLKVPSRLSVFGLGMGKFSSTDSVRLAAFSSSRHLQLLNKNGDLVWRSDEHFGGTSTLVQRYDGNISSDKDSLFLPARIEVFDVDKDGADEVVVMRNDDSSGKFLSRSRNFIKGRMEVLKAQDNSLITNWHTSFMTKLVSDFALCDLDGDGQLEILAVVIEKKNSFFKKGLSQIHVISLQENVNSAE